jgi:predicted transcriptional regulator
LLDEWGVETLDFKQGIIPRFFMSKVRDVHIGNRIKAVLKQQGRTTVWLAKQIPCTPNHLYKVYANASINTDTLKRISDILDYNFFEEFIQNG